MANIIFIGDPITLKNHTQEYIKKNAFKEYEIKYFEEKIKIEHARLIKKSLSLKISGQRLIILSGEITIECQNAILKTLEECQENVHFLFCVESEEHLLETIRSRCQLQNLGLSLLSNSAMTQLLMSVQNKNSIDWNEIDQICEFAKENGITQLLPTLRILLLENIHDKKSAEQYFTYCQKLLQYAPLVKNNNISEKIIIESIFLPAI